MSDLVPFGRQDLDKRTTRTLAHIEGRAAVERTTDKAKAALAAGRVSDLQRVTRHGLVAAASIGVEFEMEASAVESSFVHKGMARIAGAGLAGIKRQIDDLADPLA